jgi:hypothetical protein
VRPWVQVGLEDVDVVIESLQVFALDGPDAIQQFAGVECGFGVVKGLEVFAGDLRSTKVRLSVRTRKRSRFMLGT